MLWIWTVFVAAALLAWLLIAVRRYEGEGAAAALEETAQLRAQVEALAQRVQNLEAIAAVEDDVRLRQEAPSLEEERSVSSGRKPSRPS